MHLSDFVKSSLGEIILGVAEAKALTRNLASVSPGKLNNKSLLEKTEVEFEVALTTRKTDESGSVKSGKAGFEIAVLSASVGLGGGVEGSKSTLENNESISRLAFKVPVYLNAHHRGVDGPDYDEASEIERLRKTLRT